MRPGLSLHPVCIKCKLYKESKVKQSLKTLIQTIYWTYFNIESRDVIPYNYVS